MGQNSSKAQLPSQLEPKIVVAPVPNGAPSTPGFGRAQTMLDVTQAQLASATSEVSTGGLQRSSSDTALNTSTQTACQKSYQQALEWGRNEQFLKLAHTFHTNNY